jgi:FkbM family methyltransferase
MTPNVQRVQALLSAQRPREAEELARAAILSDPSDAEAHNGLGSALFGQGDTSGAVSAWERAEEADPQLYKPAANLAKALPLLGLHDRALRAASRAVDLAPELPRLRYQLALLLLQDGRHREAMEQSARAVSVEPSVASLRLLARCHWIDGATARAIEVLREASGRFPVDVGVQLQRAALEALAGVDGALDRLAQLVRAHPFASSACETLAYVAARTLGPQHPRALRACEEWSALHSVGEILPRAADPVREQPTVGVVFFDDDPAQAERLAPALRALSQQGLSVALFAEGPPRSALARAGLADRMTVLPKVAPREVARFLSARAVDVLLDAAGPTLGAGLRAFAYEPAPSQVSLAPRALRARAACFDALFDASSIEELPEALRRAITRGRSVPRGARRLPTEQGITMVVPADLSVMTSYVIAEQGRWFEDEVEFVEALVPEGGVVADIGANFGSYALPMARKIGSAGTLLAFEPSARTAELLSRSAEINGLSQMRVHRCALGAETGEVTLVHGASPELHQVGEGEGERVPCRPLDAFEDALRGLRFVKLDAEGSEGLILKGAELVLSRERPVVMFELKHGREINWDLISQFESRGFDVYSLSPGLRALTRFDPSDGGGSRLNLFAVTPDRAEELERRGMLLRAVELPEPVDALGVAGEVLRAVPPCAAFAAEPPSELSLFTAMAEVSSLPLPVRAAALRAAVRRADATIARGDPYERLTLARALRASGHRKAALQVLDAARATTAVPSAPRRPFLPVLPRYEAIIPDDWGRWVSAQVLEAWELWSAFSSCLQGSVAGRPLMELRSLSAPDFALSRRLSLVATLSGVPRE